MNNPTDKTYLLNGISRAYNLAKTNFWAVSLLLCALLLIKHSN